MHARVHSGGYSSVHDAYVGQPDGPKQHRKREAKKRQEELQTKKRTEQLAKQQ